METTLTVGYMLYREGERSGRAYFTMGERTMEYSEKRETLKSVSLSA